MAGESVSARGLTIPWNTQETASACSPDIGLGNLAAAANLSKTLDRTDAPSTLIISAGLFGSGSTWMFNVISMIMSLGHPQWRLFKTYTDHFLDEDVPQHDMDGVLAKTHRLPSAVRLLARLSDTPIILTVRDPRDAVASVMSRFRLDFDCALEDIRQSGEALAPLAFSPNVLTFRYEGRFTARRETVDIVAARLGLSLASTTRDAIWAALTPEAVMASIDALAARGAFTDAPPNETFDHETHWHPNHVGDGRVGKWRTTLSPEQATEVEQATREFRVAFDYLE
jgi:hypothetical protein